MYPYLFTVEVLFKNNLTRTNFRVSSDVKLIGFEWVEKLKKQFVRDIEAEHPELTGATAENVCITFYKECF